MASSGEPPPSKKQTMEKPAQSLNYQLTNPSLTDFKEIATYCRESLVDKTELISVFLRKKGRKLELITAPPRFGKSVNLTMFRCFFEIEVDTETGKLKTKCDPKREAVTDTDNYHLFSRLGLDIMEQEEIVQKHLGRHPVLYVSFKCDTPISNVDDVTLFGKKVVHDAFCAHEYLHKNKESKALTNGEKEYCENWCTRGQFEKLDPSDALKVLATYLYKYFEREVVMLVDEYDSLVARALVEYGERNVEEICDEYEVTLKVAKALIYEYQDWKENACDMLELTPTLLREMCKESVQNRKKMCEMNGIDANNAEKFVAEYHAMVERYTKKSIPSAAVARQLIMAHENKIVEICKKPVDMISCIVKTDDKNIHLLGALVTGVSYISGIGWSGGANNITACRFTERHQFNKFYGFQLKEIEALLRKLGDRGYQVEKDAIDIIKDRYNGYEYPYDDSAVKLFCPWSVLNYIKTRTPKFFWAGSAYTEPLKHMFEDQEVRLFLSGLFSGDTGSLPVIAKLAPDDLVKLKDHVLGKFTDGSHLLFLNFILELGYLTYDYSLEPSQNYISVKIPNVEVKFLILQTIKEYYRIKCSEDFKVSAKEKCAVMLSDIDLAANSSQSDKVFEEAVRTFRGGLQSLFCQYAKDLTELNESVLHCFMIQILTSGKFHYITEHTVGTDLNKGRLDLLGFISQFAILVELKYFPTKKKTACDALQQLIEKEYYKAFEHSAITASKVNHHILMGISVDEEKRMAIAAVRNYKAGVNYECVDIPFC